MITPGSITIIANVSFVVSIVFFFFSFIQLLHKKKPLSNYYLAIVFFAVGIQCLSFWLYYRDSPLFERYFYYLDTAFLFLIGAFLYLFFLYIASDSPITSKTWLHAVTFIAALIIIEGINLYYPSAAGKTELYIIDILISLSYLSLFIYLIMIFRVLHNYYLTKNRTPEIRILIYIILCSLVFSFFLLLSNTLWEELQLIGHIAFFCIPLLFIIFLIRYPDYFSRAQKESQEIRYLNSQIGGLDKEKIIARLELLIGQEKIYRERALSLKSLSDELDINAPQLSELLNSHYGTNFNNFINSYRIEEAKIVLGNKSDLNILEIAFECGFNSKTTFNNAFRKFTGLTPSEYKKQK